MKKAVESSMFSHVEYMPETQQLTVTWRKSGEETTYYDVPTEVGVRFFNAESHGKAYGSEIKNKYESDISRAAQVQNAPPIEEPIPDEIQEVDFEDDESEEINDRDEDLENEEEDF
jgi:hypothetical protein